MSAVEHLPEGTGPPADLPADAFAAALRAYEEERRVDMGALAAELGIGRATLYRRVGSRERLLGAVLWYRTRQVLDHALGATADLHGAARVTGILEVYLAIVADRPALRALLAREPEGTLRLITSQESPVHRGLRRVVASVLAEEEERGALRLTIDRETLAYVIVRIGEAFVYDGHLARGAAGPDHHAPVEVVARLIAGSQVGALPAPQAVDAS